MARSAAPASVSGDATVLVLERGKGYVTAVEGASGVTCFVDRTWPESIEPHCFDREASATILVLRLRFAELRERGGTMAEWEREREEGIRAGRFRLPSRPALTWMMSAGQVLHDDEGVFVGSWRPHVMIYYPGLAAEDFGLAGEPHAHGPWLSDAREPTSTLVVPMPEFVDVEGAAAGPAGPGAGARPEGGA